jgi:predicted kinase
MCGKTHSGKTTFGKKISKFVPKNVMIDNDIVGSFLNKKFHNIYNDNSILITHTPTDPDLRFLIPQLIYNYSLKNGYNVILTASHSRREIRRQQKEIAHNYNAIFVIVYFEFSKHILLERIKKSNKPTNILIAPSYEDELERQQTFFEVASPEEADFFFKITNNQDLVIVENQLKELVKDIR